jgi:dihydrolipoamide dehydrogenase
MGPKDSVDVIVIGGGPGGYYAAILAAIRGKKVLLVERDAVGGTCLNRGCIPSKALLASAEAYFSARDPSEFGVETTGASYSIDRVQERKDRIVKQMTGGVSLLLKVRGVEVVAGYGRLSGPKTVSVETAEGLREYTADAIVLAPGSVPIHLPIPGLEGERVWNSDDALESRQIPQSLAVIGGGALGLELGQYYHMLGSQVTIMEMLDHIVPPADAEAAAELTRTLARSGMKLVTGARVTHAAAGDQSVALTVETEDGQPQTVEAQVVLEAVGRKPGTDDLGLEAAGVDLDRGRIVVDGALKTTADSIWAVGDATGKLMLAHAAFKQAEVAVASICGQERTIDYATIPSCVYTHPELAWVGPTEEALQTEGTDYKVGSYPFRANGRSLCEGNRAGFAKLIADAESGRLLAAHILGPQATELVSLAACAIAFKATAEDFVRSVVVPHPTLSEALFEAAADILGESVHKA